MRVRFTADVLYETEGRGEGPRYAADEVHDLRDDRAERWLRRGVAVPTGDEPSEAEPAAGEPKTVAAADPAAAPQPAPAATVAAEEAPEPKRKRRR